MESINFISRARELSLLGKEVTINNWGNDLCKGIFRGFTFDERRDLVALVSQDEYISIQVHPSKILELYSCTF